jgi:ubiquinone/menaquinone biosynthesis C-methylase UbiE
MEIGVYAVEAVVEESHWWFAERRRLFAREIRRLPIPSDGAVLDIGTSTGTNLRMLMDMGFSQVTGLDSSDEAIRFCAEKGLGRVKKGDVCALPFPDASFDLVLATDIIEHVDADDRALAEIYRVLKPGGTALITVPAFQSLWGLQDEVSQHRRRYRKAGLLAKVSQASLVPIRHYYFNYILFGPIWVARQLIRMLRIRIASESQINTPSMNRVLGAVFSFDTRTAAILRVPFGVSIILIAERK